jgi:hypothetical protein
MADLLVVVKRNLPVVEDGDLGGKREVAIPLADTKRDAASMVVITSNDFLPLLLLLNGFIVSLGTMESTERLMDSRDVLGGLVTQKPVVRARRTFF